MIGVEVAARGFAFAAAVLLFGTSLFLVYAPREAFGAAGDAGASEWRSLRRAVRRMQLGGVTVAIIASIAWLVVHAAIIAGEPLVSADTLATVTEQTLFGRVASLRLGLLLLVGAVVASQRRERHDAALDVLNVTLAGIVLAALAWMGHAVATLGTGSRIHLGGDVVHLLAAGAWVGGLLPLAWTLVRARGSLALPAGIATQTVHRFSRLGIFCVAALLATGFINAWFLVASLDALFSTPYGQLLLVKLALFALMLLLAARNRFLWTPQIVATADAARRNAALRRLARNARIEVALGLAIVLVVGALGVMVPAAHTNMAGPNLPAPDAHAH